MDKIITGKKSYVTHEYNNEAEFEKDVLGHAQNIFGESSIYFDIKRRLKSGNIITIPDAYLIDFSFASDPHFYIVENELSVHDPYRHIGQQLLKFSSSYKSAARDIKKFLMKEILEKKNIEQKILSYLKKTQYRNIDDFLEDLIFSRSFGVIVIIDEITDDLTNVLAQLATPTDILEFKKYVNEGDKKDLIFRFEPFQQDIYSTKEGSHYPSLEAVDTIVVPANEDGFKEVFIGENCWYAIRISSIMLDKIKFIASYQTAPISAVTYYAEVSKIEKYEDTGKYIVYFKDKAKKIGPMKLVGKGMVTAPQGPRYTTMDRLAKAKNLDEVFLGSLK